MITMKLLSSSWWARYVQDNSCLSKTVCLAHLYEVYKVYKIRDLGHMQALAVQQWSTITITITITTTITITSTITVTVWVGSLMSAVLACRVIQSSPQQSAQTHKTWAADFCLSGLQPHAHWCVQVIDLRKHFLWSEQYFLTRLHQNNGRVLGMFKANTKVTTCKSKKAKWQTSW